MSNILKKACLLLAGIVLSLTACGAQSPVPAERTADEFDRGSLMQLVDRKLRAGESRFSAGYAPSEDLETAVQSALSAVMTENYLCRCLLEDIAVSFHEQETETTADFTLQYTETAAPGGPIAVVSGSAALEGVLLERLAEGPEKVPVLLDGVTFSSEELFNFLDNAEVNCALCPCEADNIYYAAYDPADDRQLLLMWLDLPVESETLASLGEELASSVRAQAEAILAEGVSTPEELYYRAFQKILSLAEYDDRLAITTLAGSGYLSEQMQIDRSAYGVFVTGSTVCTGYARGFKALCDQLGLPCWVLAGARSGADHAWNAVQLDGQTRFIDCTISDTQDTGDELFLFTEEQARALGYVPAPYSHVPW